MGFGLMIGFAELFDTTHDYTLQFTISSTVTSPPAVVRLWLPAADILLPLSSRTILGFSYWLLTATAHND
jgi:hypothetical protein